MPGIVGLITEMPMAVALPQLLRMIGILRHEPFYLSGVWMEESLGVYMGWVERRGSFSEGMPLHNERKDVTLVFSGEEFPEPGTVQRLKQQGHVFNGSGPSYLVHLYEEDPAFLAGLNGRFHGLLADRTRGTAVLFNDRYGMHRLYYHQAKDAFYFGSEAKAILEVCHNLRSLDAQSLGEFVACGAVLENRTLFKGVCVLPPASAWTFRNGSLAQTNNYFHPSEWEDLEALDSDSYRNELHQVFTRNLPRYFDGHQPIAMSLTGGLDTRMILAYRKPNPDSLPCYTFGSMFRDNQDVRVARRLAHICHQPYEVIVPGHEFLSEFPYYAERAVYLSDGCVDVGRAPDLYLNEVAREIAPVRMTGNYGGEILRGIRAFKPVSSAPGLFCKEFLSSIHQAVQTYTEIIHGHPVSFAVFKQGPWYHFGILALEQTQLSMRSPYLDNDFVRTVFRSPASAHAGHDLSLQLIASANRSLLEIPTDRGLVGKRARVSQLAHRAVLEFLFKAEYAFDLGMPQWLARVDHALTPLRLERIFTGRHKVFHFRVWYRDILAGYIQEMLLDPRSLSRQYIDRKGLEAVVRGHINGNRNFTIEINKVLTLEIVNRVFLESLTEHKKRGHPEVRMATRTGQLTTNLSPDGALGGGGVPAVEPVSGWG